MALTVLTVGKTKQDFVKTGVQEFLKRLHRYTVIRIIELPDASLKNSNPENVMEIEAEYIFNQIKTSDFLIALAADGKALSSPQFAAFLEKNMQQNIFFCIGGVYGLSPKILNRANYILSFSAFTFTHQMIRLLLLEQIYRALNILIGGSYHK
ncbi:MAG: 23S rRNA (pseudouridine(1915)-N(3))-methyltransferase RlmH [Candidatus Cloacimonetes bacterium]|nr:23S rRNA (pseudouridine(1915)-N(3))-methyltransferase RlmH [Candidatus Cloacimonadota bacterium]